MTRLFGFGPYRLDPTMRELRRGEQLLGIGSRAFDILLALVERVGQVLSSQELLALVGRDSVVDIGGLRVHMAALRKVLGDGQAGQRYIANIPLRGYTFVAINDWAAALPAETPAYISRETRGGEYWVRAAYGADLHLHQQTELSDTSIEALKVQKAFLLKWGFIQKDFDIEAWIDPRPLQQARERSREILATAW